MKKEDIDKFLNRKKPEVDHEKIKDHFRNKIVLVTGGAGSIGSEICKKLFNYEVTHVIALDLDDTRLHELWLQMGKTQGFTSYIGDIRDYQRLIELFNSYKIDIVIHAAALKHVPLLELHPYEALKTNIIGTNLLLWQAFRSSVSQFINISTDKASNPTCILGETKYIGEALASDRGTRSKIKTMSVRLGNIFGSRGSVVPIFDSQIESGGPIKVTDEKMTRFFMSIDDAVSHILGAAILNTQSSDIFTFDMGEQYSILKLAEYMISLKGLIPYKDIDISIIGLRPGEKLVEDLFGKDETYTEITSGVYKIEKHRVIDINRKYNDLTALPLSSSNAREKIEEILK